VRGHEVKTTLALLAFLSLGLCAGTSLATKPARVVLLPLAQSKDPAEAKLASAVEAALVEAVKKLPAMELANYDGKLKGPRVDAKSDPRPQTRGQALAKELGADMAIVAEPQPLGDGAVVYLQVVEPAGKVRGSTTVAISAEALRTSELERALRGGVVQIVDPARFVGHVELRIDVKGAEVDVDGKRAAPATQGSSVQLDLAVGTHAVRVTHPAYRDYLRFVEVAYDKATVENVAMAMFPLTEGEMADRRRGTGPVRKVPWYRSWWALGLTGAVLCGATVGLVYGLRPSVESDLKTTYKSGPSF
jgi:hypothetical protein